MREADALCPCPTRVLRSLVHLALDDSALQLCLSPLLNLDGRLVRDPHGATRPLSGGELLVLDSVGPSLIPHLPSPLSLLPSRFEVPFSPSWCSVTMKSRLLLFLWLALTTLAWGQSPSPSASPSAEPAPSPTTVDTSVAPPAPQQPVSLRLNTLTLFTLTGTSRMSAEERAAQVKERLREALRRNKNQVPPVYVDNVLGSTVVRAGDEIIITVVDEDLGEFDPDTMTLAERRKLENDLAERWRDAIQTELERSSLMYTSSYRWVAFSLVGILLTLAYLGHRLIKHLSRKPLWSLKFLVWTVAILFCLRLFPETQTWAEHLYANVLWPFLLLLIVMVGTNLVSVLVERLLHQYFLALQRQQHVYHLTRLGQRMSTLDQACRVTAHFILILAGGLVYLTLLKVDLRPILAGAGVVGVALGFATQDLLKDVVAGVNILVEDSFGVGDVIEWSNMTGNVEAFNLRSTRVRTIDGRLITVPNSDLRLVQNHSNRWSRVDFRVDVAYRVDLEFAIDVLMQEAGRLSAEWNDRILEPPVLLGVDRLGPSGVTLRLLLQTRPLSQWEVGRELNRRVKVRFDKEKIEIPFPQQRVWLTEPAKEAS